MKCFRLVIHALFGPLFALYASASQATEILVYGNDSMPFCGMENGQPAGMAVEILNAVTAAGGPKFRFDFSLPWTRAQMEVQSANNELVAIIPFTRTESRENKYRWITVLFEDNVRLVSVGRSAPLKTVDEAKELNVGILHGSAHEPKLKEMGFSRVEAVRNDEMNARKMHMGRLDAWLVSSFVDKYMYRKIGADPAVLQYGPLLGNSTQIYIAAAPGFPDEYAKAIADGVQRLRANGKLEQILNKYR